LELRIAAWGRVDEFGGEVHAAPEPDSAPLKSNTANKNIEAKTTFFEPFTKSGNMSCEERDCYL
jgi:hypothetical protein